MNGNEFLRLVAEMREAQRTYFRERTYVSLSKAKALEKRVDDAISKIRHDALTDNTTQLVFDF